MGCCGAGIGVLGHQSALLEDGSDQFCAKPGASVGLAGPHERPGHAGIAKFFSDLRSRKREHALFGRFGAADAEVGVSWVFAGAFGELDADGVVEDARDVGHHASRSGIFSDGNLDVCVGAPLGEGGDEVERGFFPPLVSDLVEHEGDAGSSSGRGGGHGERVGCVVFYFARCVGVLIPRCEASCAVVKNIAWCNNAAEARSQ